MSFPDQYARTIGFTAGEPRDLKVASTGEHVAYLRSSDSRSTSLSLWLTSLSTGHERLLVDAGDLPAGPAPATERVLQERRRDTATGIIEYSADGVLGRFTFAEGGRLWTCEASSANVREIPVEAEVTQPLIDPTGERIAYLTNGELWVVSWDGSDRRRIATPESESVTYGLVDHIGAQSFKRRHGMCWSPDGLRLLVDRVDTRRVSELYLVDPTRPDVPSTRLRWPVAGSANPEVSLWVFDLDGSRTEVTWDVDAYEYVVAARWDTFGPLILVQSRSQTSQQVLKVDDSTGTTKLLHEDRHPVWVALIPGVPARTADGALVFHRDCDDSRQLLVDGQPVTPPDLLLRVVHEVCGNTVLFSASPDPTVMHLYSWSRSDGLGQLTHDPGVHEGAMGGTTVATISQTLSGRSVTVRHKKLAPKRITSVAEQPTVVPEVAFLLGGSSKIRMTILLPPGHEPGSGSLPVLMDPYGGPAEQRVTAERRQYLVSQWFADQGFAVVIADGRGTPGRGPRWERSIHRAKVGPALEDQVSALHFAAEEVADLDLNRVVIRGKSYGGTLALAAVLRRPDVFHGGIATASVTDQRLYSTWYQERYLGHPDEHPDVYAQCSLLDEAATLTRPLMLIHGLADDNVLASHTLRFSANLVDAGRQHSLVILPDETHNITRSPTTVANLLTLQLSFLRTCLGVYTNNQSHNDTEPVAVPSARRDERQP